MKKTSKAQRQASLDSENDDGKGRHQRGGAGKNGKDGKSQNTIIQQINGFAMTPLNDRLAEQTIEDHKYLLELVENRAAIAYFAVANRNQSLFTALKNFLKEEDKQDEDKQAKDKQEEQHSSLHVSLPQSWPDPSRPVPFLVQLEYILLRYFNLKYLLK
jgi:hypothetical protein